MAGKRFRQLQEHWPTLMPRAVLTADNRSFCFRPWMTIFTVSVSMILLFAFRCALPGAWVACRAGSGGARRLDSGVEVTAAGRAVGGQRAQALALSQGGGDINVTHLRRGVRVPACCPALRVVPSRSACLSRAPMHYMHMHMDSR